MSLSAARISENTQALSPARVSPSSGSLLAICSASEDAFVELIAPRREAPRLREAQLLFTLGSPFAELSAACLLFTDAGVNGGRH